MIHLDVYISQRRLTILSVSGLKTMNDPKFAWGEGIDEKLKHINVCTLTDVCRPLPSFKESGRSHEALYSLLSSQDETRQRQAYKEVQHILANPTNTKCKGTWVAKRKQEDEDTYIRNVKARLESINNSF